MDLTNNPTLYPREDGLNPLKPIVERLNTLEGITKNYADSFETKELNITENAQIENLNANTGNIATLESTDATITNLNVTNDDIKNATVENLHVTEKVQIDNLITDEPILSNAVVGYNDEGKMIPIRIITPSESPLYFDYTVDSQDKFEDLLTILKSGTPNTYKSIAIVGGYGAGEHGEYLYTIDSDSGEANLNNAIVIGFNDAKIVITADDVDTFKVFKNGSFKYITFNVGGTVLSDNTLTLISNSTVDSCEILHNATPINFVIDTTTLIKTINNEYITFNKCTLNECETIQSVFVECSSEMLYVKTDANIVSKYSFNKCGIHLDMKKTDMTQLETVTINISSLTNTNLTVLDESSKLKKIILNVDDSDVFSSIVGNNDKEYSIYKDYFAQIRKSISPSMRDKAYISTADESFTPIFSENGTDFYIDEAMTIPVYFWDVDNNGNPYIESFGFTTTTTPNGTYFNTLAFKGKVETAVEAVRISGVEHKIPNFADEYILNGTPIKQYHIKNDDSNVLVYSSNDGTDFYLNPEDSSHKGKVSYVAGVDWDNPSDIWGYGIMIGVNGDVFKNLRNVMNWDVKNARHIPATMDLLEITPPKDNYNVQVVSNFDAKVNVEKAFFTKVKND